MRRLLALLLLLGPGAAMAEEGGTRIAYVDMQRLLDSAPQVTAAQARLTREFAARDLALKADQAKLRAMEDKLRRDTPLMSREAAATLQQETETLRRAVARTRARLDEELKTRTQEEIDRAWPAITEAVADYAREHGYDLVVPSPVIYVSGRIDITDRVLEQLRQTAEAPAP